MIKLFVFLLFAISVLGQEMPVTSTIWMEHKDLESNFSITMLPNGVVSWKWNQLTYDVLGSTLCPAGQYLMRSGNNWVCNPDTTGTGDSLTAAISQCGATAGVNVPKSNGTGAYICASDSDLIGKLTCSIAQIPKKIAGVWTCAPDDDTAAGARIQCSAAAVRSIPRFRNSSIASQKLACTPTWPDNDTAKALAASGGCADGNVVKYNRQTHTWYCAQDNSLLTYRTCPAGQLLKKTATNWTCALPSDTLKTLAPLCTAELNTPILTVNGWVCIATPTVHQLYPRSTVFQTVTLTVPPHSTVPSQPNSFVGAGGLPFYSPYQANLTAWSIRGYSSTSGIVRVNYYNGVASLLGASATISSSVPFYRLETPVGGLLLTNTSYGIQVENTGSVGVTLTVDFYISMFLRP